MRKKEVIDDRLKITLQYHERGGTSYDFGVKLRLRVFRRTKQEEPAEWRVEACTSDAPGVPIITGWGDTRASALTSTERTWVSESVGRGLPVFDWHVITEALAAVRAI